MNLFHDNIYKDVAQDDFAVAEVINKCGIEYVAPLCKVCVRKWPKLGRRGKLAVSMVITAKGN